MGAVRVEQTAAGTDAGRVVACRRSRGGTLATTKRGGRGQGELLADWADKDRVVAVDRLEGDLDLPMSKKAQSFSV